LSIFSEPSDQPWWQFGLPKPGVQQMDGPRPVGVVSELLADAILQGVERVVVGTLDQGDDPVTECHAGPRFRSCVSMAFRSADSLRLQEEHRPLRLEGGLPGSDYGGRLDTDQIQAPSGSVRHRVRTDA